MFGEMIVDLLLVAKFEACPTLKWPPCKQIKSSDFWAHGRSHRKTDVWINRQMCNLKQYLRLTLKSVTV